MSQVYKEALKPEMEALEEAFAACNVDYYLIGALARETWFAGIN